MNIELLIIKLFYNYNFYKKFIDYIDKDFIKDNNRELYRILRSIETYHEKFPEKNISSTDDLRVFHFTCYPTASKKQEEELEPLFKRLETALPDVSVVSDYLRSHRERTIACRLAIAALEVSDGKQAPDEFWSEVAKMEESRDAPIGPEEEDEFVSDDLSSLQEQLMSGGLKWRLKFLNQSLGPLRKGDFGFVFARPETGKTTFLASEVTFMAGQLSEKDGPIIWFNNEEQGEKVVLRCYQAGLGITSQELFSNLPINQNKYSSFGGSRIKIKDDASIHRRDVDRICSRFNPSLIVLDQIDKIKGFQGDRNDLELKEIYNWARELAKNYGPVIAVCQAGGTAEGKKWLTMDDVDNSKTSKQGEADWILGIGKTHNLGMEAIRHFNISKNKLIGDSETIPEMRHAMKDILILPEIARYQDIGHIND